MDLLDNVENAINNSNPPFPPLGKVEPNLNPPLGKVEPNLNPPLGKVEPNLNPPLGKLFLVPPFLHLLTFQTPILL